MLADNASFDRIDMTKPPGLACGITGREYQERRRVKFRYFAVAALIFVAIVGETTAQVKTLVFCSNESPDILNPQLSFRQATFDASSRQLYDRLVTYEPGKAEIVPSLATSWRISEDGLRYEFQLRPNVPFHNMRHFTPTRALAAEDVVFSFMRQLDPKHPYHKVSGGVYPYFTGLGLQKVIKSVVAGDAGTVIFELKSPYPAFLSTLALDFASILSAEYADAMLAAGTPERVDMEPVATGPFQLAQHHRDALIRYVAHQAYWRGKTPLDNLVFTITPDATVRYQKLRDRECHVIADPDPADIPAMTLDDDVKLVRQVGVDVGYLAFNTRKPPLNDPRVRKALALAINREAILEKIYQGIGEPAAAMIPPGLWPHGAAAAAPADIERAKRLLEEASVFRMELEIWPSPVARSYMPDARRTAEMIHEDWLKIGVESKIIITTGGDFIKQTMVGQHDVALFGWIAETLDRSLFLAPILGCEAARSGANRSYWCNGNFDRLLDEAARARSPAERETLYELAQTVLDDEVPILPIAHSIIFTPMRNEVINYRAFPLGGYYFYGVDLE
jgi:dipeptide transport system substrate-binding protein